MKKISVIVPLYNSEKFIDKLILSILEQTYYNLEIILVDDGSPDESGNIADSYAERDSRIFVIHQENEGACNARNSGLMAATGDYIMFVDGDDWLESDCVEYLVSLAENNDAQMSMTDSIFTTRERIQNTSDNIRVWDNGEAVAGILNSFIIPVGPWNKLYSSQVIRNNNISFSVPWFGEGLYFSTMAAMYSSRIAVGHRKVYNYRLNNLGSGCTIKNPKHGVNALNNIKYIKDSLIIDSSDIQKALNFHIWGCNYSLLMYIVGAEKTERAMYRKEFVSSRLELFRLLPKVLKHDLLSHKKKFLYIMESLFPVLIAKIRLEMDERALRNDTMDM